MSHAFHGTIYLRVNTQVVGDSFSAKLDSCPLLWFGNKYSSELSGSQSQKGNMSYTGIIQHYKRKSYSFIKIGKLFSGTKI